MKLSKEILTEIFNSKNLNVNDRKGSKYSPGHLCINASNSYNSEVEIQIEYYSAEQKEKDDDGDTIDSGTIQLSPSNQKEVIDNVSEVLDFFKTNYTVPVMTNDLILSFLAGESKPEQSDEETVEKYIQEFEKNAPKVLAFLSHPKVQEFITAIFSHPILKKQSNNFISEFVAKLKSK